MIETIIVNSKENECKVLHTLAKDAISRISDEKLELKNWTDQDIEALYTGDDRLIDALMVEILGDESKKIAETLRSYFKNSEMLVISNQNISPMKYLNPAIRASSLLLRPFSSEMARSVVTDFYMSIMSQRETSKEACFVIENQDGKQLIPYSDIYYFEVREKKVHARTRLQVFSKYGTLEQLETTLPAQFMRCHRSYIVNTDRIVKVKITEGDIYLTDEVIVPLARSYKTAIKEFIHAAKG